MRREMQWLLVAVMALAAAACSRKQEVAPSPVIGETARSGAKLAYEHRLNIGMAQDAIGPRMAEVRQACESAQFGACNVLAIEQGSSGGTLDLRVVPAGVEPLTRMASRDGHVAQRQTRAEDLADAVDDTARQRQELDAYAQQMDQLAQRKDLSATDVIALAHERAQIQVKRTQLDNLAAQQQRRLDTNRLTLIFSDTERGGGWGMAWNDWVDRLHEGVSDTLYVVAYGLPFLLLAFPLALLWRWIWRKATRRSRERKVG